MTDVPLEAYLATIRPDAHDTVRALVAAIDAAGIEFDCAIKYGLLLYTFDARWHDWVVAVGATSKVVNLRFLFRDRITDTAGLLRPGSTTAGTIDYRSAGEVDASVVTAYVREATAGQARR